MEHPHERIFQKMSRQSRCDTLQPRRDKVECMIRLDFPTTNNEAEYETLIAGLDLAKVAGAESMIVYGDS